MTYIDGRCNIIIYRGSVLAVIHRDRSTNARSAHGHIQTFRPSELRPAFVNVSVHFIVDVVQIVAVVIEAGVLVLFPQFVLTRPRRQTLLVVDPHVAVVPPNYDDDDDEDNRYDDEPYDESETEVGTDEVPAPGAVLQERV